MNQLKKQLLCLAVLVNTMHLYGDEITTTNIVARSQSFNAARQLVGWDNAQWGINRQAPDDRYYLSFNLLFEYTRTFRNSGITECLFGSDLVCTGCDDDLSINVSGSLVQNRAPTDWLADYFGLPLNFQSTVTFNPKITNYILDFSFFAGLDAWVDGLYFRIHGPFVRTSWNLNATECVGAPASNTFANLLAYNGIVYPAGYFTAIPVTTSEQINTSFLSYANGATPVLSNYGGTDLIWQPLCCSRMINSCDCDSDAGFTRNGFGELRFMLGRNFFSEREDRDCHLGVGVYAAAPTGTRVGESRYLFEPIVGNGKHWELGAQVTGHHIWWKSEDENRSFGVYFEANITHLFGASQDRCFDLCSAGNNSRFMLAENLQYYTTQLLQSSQTAPLFYLNPAVDPQGLQFAGEVAPVANLTRRTVTSTIGAQGDLAISFAYQAGGFQWDLGYNFWGRSCEKLKISDDCCPVIQGTWALKGTALVYGFDNLVVPGLAVPLAATDSSATIHGGSNTFNTFEGGSRFNQGIDNNVLAFDQTGSPGNPLFSTAAGTNPNTQTYTSNPAVLIDESDFNFSGTRGISNKFYTHFNYAWPDVKDTKWTPYVGIGGEVEFGTKKSDGNGCGTSCDTSCNTTCNPCNTSCDTSCNTSCTPTCYPPVQACSTLRECCSNCAISQWGVWFKVGTSYN